MKRPLLTMAVTAITMIVGLTPARAQMPERFAEQQQLAQTIAKRLTKAHLRQTCWLRAAERVIGTTPRHRFVPDSVQIDAYQDRPLPIGYGQTVSDPAIVAWMTSLLQLKRDNRVLEIGTGSGYQAAILSKLTAQVFSIEIVEQLAREAAERLARLGYSNVMVRSGDGYAGWPEHQPFDAIIVTAGAPRIPPALLAQLKPGGRMVIPLGPNWAQEQLTLIEKDRHGKIKQHALGPVFFVDFTGEMGRTQSMPH